MRPEFDDRGWGKVVQPNIKRYLKCLWKWVAPIGLLLLIELSIPLIWFCFSGEADKNTDYLAYYGAVLGAAATLIAVTSQIRADARGRKEERAQSTRPVLWVGNDTDFERRRVDSLTVSSRAELIASREQNACADYKGDIDMERDYVVLVQQDGKWVPELHGHKSLDEQFCEKAHSESYYEFSDSGVTFTRYSPYYSIPLVIKNVGVGPALNYRPGIRFRDEESASYFGSPRLLCVGEEDRVVICVDCSGISGNTSFSFDFTVTFETVMGATFRSVTKVKFEDDGKGIRSHSLKIVPELESVELSDQES